MADKYIIFGNGKKYKIVDNPDIVKQVLIPKQDDDRSIITQQIDEIEQEQVQQKTKKGGKQK